jgi:hypothetical protein
MSRMRELSSSLSKLGSRSAPPEQESSDVADVEMRVLSPAERREDLERYVESDEFATHNERVAELLLNGDEDGLVEFANEGAAEEAAARVAEIRAAR